MSKIVTAPVKGEIYKRTVFYKDTGNVLSYTLRVRYLDQRSSNGMRFSFEVLGGDIPNRTHWNKEDILFIMPDQFPISTFPVGSVIDLIIYEPEKDGEAT